MKYIQFKTIGLIGIGVASWLTACGGGGSSSPTVVTPAPSINRPPIASASTDSSTVSESSSATLSASASSDPDGDTLSYEWVQLSGSTAEIVSPRSAQTDVNFGEVDLDETVTFEVRISDGEFQDSAEVEIVLQNASDKPGSDGVLKISVEGEVAALFGNTRSRGQDDSEILYVTKDENGNTSTVYYEIDGTGDGGIEKGVPLRKMDGYQDFHPDVKFEPGYDFRVNSNFFAIEPDRVLLMHDPDYDPETYYERDPSSWTYEIGVEFPGENACMVYTRYLRDPYSRGAEVGYVMIGYEGGGAKIFSWPADEPENLTEQVIGSTKSYCDAIPGFVARGPGFRATLALLDTENQSLDFYILSGGQGLSLNLDESVDLSTLGLNPVAKHVQGSRGKFFTQDETGQSHQGVFIRHDVCNVAGPGIFRGVADDSCFYVRVYDIGGSLPTAMEVDVNEVGSPFYESSVQDNRLLILAQPDMNRVIKFPFASTTYNLSSAIYQDVETPIQSLKRYESRLGLDRRYIFLRPDQKSITVYPWAAPPLP